MKERKERPIEHVEMIIQYTASDESLAARLHQNCTSTQLTAWIKDKIGKRYGSELKQGKVDLIVAAIEMKKEPLT